MTEKQDSAEKLILDIAISPDGMEAYGIVNSPEDESAVTVDAVLQQLGAAGVSEGIDEAAVEQLVQERQWNDRVTLATGTKAEPPTNGTVALPVEGPFPVRVELHQVVGTIVPPVDGKAGRTVTGKIQEPAPPVPYVFMGKAGLKIHPDNKDQIIAAKSGYLHLAGDIPERVEPLWTFEIASDDMECQVTVTRPPREGLTTPQELTAALEAEEISYGIDADSIASIFKKSLFEQPVVVVRGTPAEPGENGRIEYLFNTETMPVKDAKGNVDHKAVKVRNVRKDDPLMRIIEPTKGVPGKTIRGKDVAAEDGKAIQPKLGANVDVSKDDPQLYCAAINGRVLKKSSGQIAVDSMFEVHDVDYETGNIDFVGSVLVKGDVKSGFSVHADGDVVVIGVIEDAEVTATGSVQGGGFIGQNKGCILADGDVALNFCENQKIVSKGNVSIREALLHARVECKGFVEAIESKGTIIGGRIIAVKGLKALRVGNENEIKGHITVGMDADILKEIKEIDNALNAHEANVRKVTRGIDLLAKMELLKPLKPTKQKVKEELQKTLVQLESETESLPKNREELLKKMEEFRDATVTVLKEIYPGNTITIVNSHHKVTEAMEGVRFLYKDGIIESQAFSA